MTATADSLQTSLEKLESSVGLLIKAIDHWRENPTNPKSSDSLEAVAKTPSNTATTPKPTVPFTSSPTPTPATAAANPIPFVGNPKPTATNPPNPVPASPSTYNIAQPGRIAPTNNTYGVQAPTPLPQPPKPQQPSTATTSLNNPFAAAWKNPFQTANGPVAPPPPSPKPKFPTRQPKSWLQRTMTRAKAHMRRGRTVRAKAGKKVNRIAQAVNAFASPKGAVNAGADMLAGMGGIVGKVAGPFAATVTALKGFHDQVDKDTEALQAHNAALGEFSAKMAVVMTQRETQEMLRNQKKGDLEAASAQYLTNAEQGRKDSTKDIEILWDKISNYGEGALNELLGAILDPLNDIAAGINELVGSDEKKSVQALGEFLGTIDATGMQEVVRRAEKDARRKGERG